MLSLNRARFDAFGCGLLRRFGLALLLIGFWITTSASAKSKFNKVVDVGDKAFAWESIPGTDDKKHSLVDFKDAKAVVVVFTCNHCPVAKGYESRLLAFAKKYAERGVQVVAINVNRNDADGLEKMKVRAKESGFTFPYLFDETQKSARAYGAVGTPHFFLLDKERRIAYMGAFDDNLNAEKVEKHYLIDAVEAVLDGKAAPVKESLQRGCEIQYE